MPGNPLTDPTWAPYLADNLERLVTTVRDRTTRPILLVMRGVIFGLVAGIGGVVAIVLLVIALVRALQAFLDIFLEHHDAVWVSYLLLGAIFSVAGLIVLVKRFPAPPPEVPV